MDEKAYLTALQSQPLGRRLAGYLKLTGPGYMQSAMTLGGGTIASCVLMGSLLGYKMLWVQPIAILLGVCVLGAVAKITTLTQEKPYLSFWNRLHPGMALCWGISSFVATILWHIPQYGLTANGAIVLGEGAGISLDSTPGRIGIGVVVLAAASAIVYLYQTGAKGLKYYELLVKVLVWSIVGAFAIAAFASGIDWKELLLGVSGISFAQMVSAHGGIPPEVIPPMVAALAAAVGINMIFLYPYSLLNKEWGPEHKELAYFDLVSGMMVPFLVATGFMTVAVANTIGPEGAALGESVKDMREILPVLSGTLGGSGASFIIGLGMFAVGFSTIITHMLACGFIGCELFGLDAKDPRKFLFALAPAVGVVGVMIKFPFWAAVTASVMAAPLMPITVLGFLILLNLKSFMGANTPHGAKGLFHNAMLLTSICVLSIGAYFSLYPIVTGFFAPEPAAAPAPAEAVPEEAPQASAALPSPLREFTYAHDAMGTTFEIRMMAAGKFMEDLRPIADEAFAAIDALEARVSNWREDSITSEICRQAGIKAVSVDEDILGMLRFCRALYNQTDGVFDPTVGPLLKAWGKYKQRNEIPTDEELKRAQALVGLNQIEVDETNGTVMLEQPGMQLDFGGIAKGLALDEAAAVLKGHGIACAFLHSGMSTIVALDAPPGSEGWTVELGNPYTEGQTALDTVLLANNAFSSSASVTRFIEIDGKRYGHIIDPRTGYPASGVASAAVVGPTGMACDALSTAFYILGIEKTRQFCREHGEYKALMVAATEPQDATMIRINFSNEEERT